MIILLVTFCQMAAATCDKPVVIATSEQDPELNMMSCMTGMPKIVEWMKDSPKYHDARIAKWECVIGKPADEIATRPL